MKNFGHVFTAMVTPFDNELKVDFNRLSELALKLLDSGSTGLVIVGTTGESPTLTKEEKLSIFRAVKEVVGNKAPVIAGTGSYSTQESVSLSKEAEKTGVDGLLIVNPYYNKPSQEGLYEHFKSIAESVDLPIILYNHPGRTGVSIEPKTMERLSKIKNIVGVKDSSGSLSLISEYRLCTPSDFMIYSGDDPLTLPILSIGGCGVISVASHIAGTEINKMVTSFIKGDIEPAREIHYKLFDLFKVLFCAPSPAPTKAALKMTGFPVGSVRLPLVDVNESDYAKIKAVCAKFY